MAPDSLEKGVKPNHSNILGGCISSKRFALGTGLLTRNACKPMNTLRPEVLAPESVFVKTAIAATVLHRTRSAQSGIYKTSKSHRVRDRVRLSELL